MCSLKCFAVPTDKMKDTVIAKLANQAADFYGDAFKQCQYKDNLPKVWSGDACTSTLTQVGCNSNTDTVSHVFSAVNIHTESGFCMVLCVYCLFDGVYCFCMFLLLENDMIIGTQVGGLLKFPPVSVVIISFPSFFSSWCFDYY